MRRITARGCILEPQTRDHAAEMFQVLSDPAIYEFENSAPESEEWLIERYSRLESRASSDGREKWLNWVVQLPGGPLAGYVQATVLPSAVALIAYELNSGYWRQGIGSDAVAAMLEELRVYYRVHRYVAVLKSSNFRSLRLLRRLRFDLADEQEAAVYRDESDELVMVRADGGCERPG